MAKVYILFADGVEEIEALTAVDVLRRGNQDAVMVSVTGERVITGSHGIRFATDCLLEDTDCTDGAMLVLPGGGPGTKALKAHAGVEKLLRRYDEEEKLIGAICAAPSVLGKYGLLRGHRATCFPGFEQELTGADVTGASVETDGRFITGKGMGVSVEFAIALLRALAPEEADRVAAAIQMR